MAYKKIQGETVWVKDTSSGAVLNTDIEGLQAYRNMRDLKNSQRNRLEDCIQEVSNLKDDINEIKGLLLNMVGNK